MQHLNNFPNQFQQRSLELVESLIPLSSAVFYLVGPNMQHHGIVLHNLDIKSDRDYVNHYAKLDPLNPKRFEKTGETLVSIDSQISPQLLRQSIYYQEFMQPYNHRYVVDMFFRQQGRIIAVLSMLRHEALGAYSEQELALLRKVQPFLEYALNTVYMPRRVAERQSIREQYELTDRELDVLELIMGGANNKTIASDLGLSIATVKTHLQHIFQKASVASRAELLSKVIAALV